MTEIGEELTYQQVHWLLVELRRYGSLVLSGKDAFAYITRLRTALEMLETRLQACHWELSEINGRAVSTCGLDSEFLWDFVGRGSVIRFCPNCGRKIDLRWQRMSEDDYE